MERTAIPSDIAQHVLALMRPMAGVDARRIPIALMALIEGAADDDLRVRILAHIFEHWPLATFLPLRQAPESSYPALPGPEAFEGFDLDGALRRRFKELFASVETDRHHGQCSSMDAARRALVFLDAHGSNVPAKGSALAAMMTSATFDFARHAFTASEVPSEPLLDDHSYRDIVWRNYEILRACRGAFLGAIDPDGLPATKSGAAAIILREIRTIPDAFEQSVMLGTLLEIVFDAGAQCAAAGVVSPSGVRLP
ncbi:MAG: hypothetical protein Q7R80_03430 [bacterium]|nr:hypothetical protein [bacterium]